MGMKYSIEICGPRNECHSFAPLGETLRGRWDASKVAHRDKSEGMKAISQVPVIPGMYLCLETEVGPNHAGRGTRLDPLRETADGRKVWEQVKAVIREYRSEFGSIDKLAEPAVHELDATQVKTWAFCMRQLIDTGLARVVDGSATLPEQSEIRKWPGSRVRDPWNTGSQEEKLRKYVDEVPLETELVGAGAGGEGNKPQGGGKQNK